MNSEEMAEPIKRPLADVRVLEFSTGIAGPICGRALAHHGADVIKIETLRRPDTIRLFPSPWVSPQLDERIRGDISPMWNEFNAEKRSAAIDLKASESRPLIKRLLKKSDVFLINFSAPTASKWQLTYEDVLPINPAIIYLSLPAFGNTPGPYYEYRAWGPNLAGLAGLDYLTGWPDRPPSGIGSVALSDYTNGLHALFAILTALDYRDATGSGQYIDMSQYEATIACLGPSIMEFMANGTVPQRRGNRSEHAAPQGVYPCDGSDRWIALSVVGDDEWSAFCQLAEHPEWASDDRFRTHRNRIAHHDTLDALVGAWTATQASGFVVERLQRAGIAAAEVADARLVAQDPQLASRGFWKLVRHRWFGVDLLSGHPIHLSETPPRSERAGPALGQDTISVLQDLCDCSAGEIEVLLRKEIVAPPADDDVRLQRPYWSWIRDLMPSLAWPSEFDDAFEPEESMGSGSANGTH